MAERTPLTEQEKQDGCLLVSQKLAQDVINCRKLMEKAQAAYEEASRRIRAWSDSQALTTQQAVAVYFAHLSALDTAGQEAAFRGGDPAVFHDLQAKKDLLARYLEELGHPVAGEDL